MKSNLIIAAGAMLVASGCTTPNPNPNAVTLESAVTKAGYTPYRPIRSNWGPGFLFLGAMPSPTPACPNLYGDTLAFDDLENADIYFQDITQNNTNGFNLSLDFLKDIVGADNSAKLQLAKVENSSDLTIKWGPVKEYAYYLSTAYGRPIHPDCLAMLRRMKQQGKLGEVKMMTRAIAVKDLSYELKTAGRGGGGLDLSIAQVLNGKLGEGNWSYSDTGTLKITKPVFIGYAAPSGLADYVDTGEVSGAAPRVMFTFTPS